MAAIGTVDSLWRYPVKSMRGERVETAFCGFAGVYGDRLYAFRDPGGYAGFPWLTGRELREMLRYVPQFRAPERAGLPPHVHAALAAGPGVTAVYGDTDALALDVLTPDGERLAIDDPALAARLRDAAGLDAMPDLLVSDRALTDCRPLSLFTRQTAGALAAELGRDIDPRRFRANICLDLPRFSGFAENDLVGRQLKVGERVVVAVLETDPRCAMITLDPDTGASDPAVLRHVAKAHANMAGLYAAVLVEGVVHAGDAVCIEDERAHGGAPR